MAGKHGERSTGGARPRQRRAAGREEEAFAELLAEKKTPTDGKGTPMNIIRRPIAEPTMVNIKDGEEPA